MSRGFQCSRREFGVGLAASLAVGAGAAGRAAAQDYPGGPVQIAVAYGPGGGTDTFARVLAPSLARILNRPVTVQNLPGGGGQVAATTVLRDGGDGLTILATNEPDLSMSTVFNKPPYKISDFQVVMVDVVDPRVMLVQAGSDIASFGDFVARAKAAPRKLAVSVAQGSAQETFAKWLFEKLDIQVRLVGYNGGGPSANALLAGDVTATIGDDFARLNIRDKSKALFVGAPAKSPRWPEAPTLTDALAPLGVTPPSQSFLARYGVYVVPSAFKAKYPAAYARLQKAMLEARETPEFQKHIATLKIADLSVGRPGEEFATAFASDLTAITNLKN
jgi:tripartite-type tricarboxylate transporter receptor subunit TctC